MSITTTTSHTAITKRLFRATFALCLASIVVFANLYATQPLLPLLAESFSVTQAQTLQSLTLTTLMLAISLLIYGPVSDIWGRKVVMLSSFIGMCITTLALSLIDNFEQLLWLRAIHGFFLGGLPATAIAYIGEEFPRTRIAATVGLYISANSIGGIGGRILSGAISDWWDWQAVFVILTVCNLAAMILLALLLPKSSEFQRYRFKLNRLLNPLTHLQNRTLLVAFLIGGSNFMIVLTLYSYLTFLLAEPPYSLSPSWLGLLFLTYIAGSLSSALTSYFNHSFSCAQQIILGTCLILIGTLCTLQGHLGLIILGLLVNGFGFFLAHSNLSTWVNQYAQHSKASASSLYLVFYYLGASIGNSYLNPFWIWWGWAGVVLGGILVIALSLLGGFYLYGDEKSNRIKPNNTADNTNHCEQ